MRSIEKFNKEICQDICLEYETANKHTMLCAIRWGLAYELLMPKRSISRVYQTSLKTIETNFAKSCLNILYNSVAISTHPNRIFEVYSDTLFGIYIANNKFFKTFFEDHGFNSSDIEQYAGWKYKYEYEDEYIIESEISKDKYVQKKILEQAKSQDVEWCKGAGNKTKVPKNKEVPLKILKKLFCDKDIGHRFRFGKFTYNLDELIVRFEEELNKEY